MIQQKSEQELRADLCVVVDPSTNSIKNMTSTDLKAGTKVPTLLGIEGLVKGEVFPLTDGNEIIVGRSRSCDISLRKLESYRSMPTEDRDNDHDFNTVSRSHIRIQVLKENQIRFEDISTNGTYWNDQLITEPIDVDLNNPPNDTIIRLGARESFRVALCDPSELSSEGGKDSSFFSEFEDKQPSDGTDG